MWSFIAVAVIVLVPMISVIVRMRAAAKVPTFFWVILLVAPALPAVVAKSVLMPQTSIQSGQVTKVNDVVRLNMPEQHSLLVTAELGEIDPEDPASHKTDYSFKIVGVKGSKTWQQTISGTIERAAENPNEIKLESFQGKEISTSGSRRDSAGIRENLQDRYELKQHGSVKITAANYQGKAVTALALDVIPAPPPASILWSVALIFTIFGIYYESWKQCDKVGGDISFIVFCYQCIIIIPIIFYLHKLFSFFSFALCVFSK